MPGARDLPAEVAVCIMYKIIKYKRNQNGLSSK